jgi:hypothetical protein
MQQFFQDNRIETYFSSSAFTFHNKVVDVVIKTIRDAIGYRIINNFQLQQIVEYYNNTIHRAIGCTPLEMMLNKEYEAQYIRFCMQKVIEINKRQVNQGLLNYQRGNILLLHCELGKTSNRDEKSRNYWNRIGEFIGYENGNAQVQLLRNQLPIYIGQRAVTQFDIPVYFTKIIAQDIDNVPEYYKRNFGF